MNFLFDFTSLIKSLIVNLAIFAIWYACEFQQFGTLQFDRQCDEVISFIYILVIWYFIHKLEYKDKNKSEH